MKTKEEYIEKSNLIHNNFYDYSLIPDKILSNEKIKIICPIHGVFEQNEKSHLKGFGCKKCGIDKIRDTKKSFIEKSKKINGDLYDYSLVEYKNSHTKVKIICAVHGVFEQTPNAHLSGNRCLKCVNENQTFTKKDFIKKSKKINGDLYDYSLVNYINNHTKVKIICRIHGIFEQTPNSHFNGKKCLKCYLEEKRKSMELKFIQESKKINGDLYDYSLVVYEKSVCKVKIICPVHGVFLQTPNKHLQGQGCPICKESKGEKEISKFLEKKNIKYIREKRFNDCRNKNTLPFDFYLPDYNMCIEFDGEQHFKTNEHFGGEEIFKITQKNDNLKNDYCKKNNIKILRIRYDEKIDDLFNI